MCEHPSNFVVPLQIRTLKPFPAASADSLDYSQMNLVPMTTSSPGALHFLLAGHNPGAWLLA
ncbi:hypothetical protein M405DRAFT_824802 [Rhizopogon salebrosus TDB-379]|nr:hypothetical protein M405DRAFT_824802 [Rhizopogon salebrosus TDB-379]